MFTIDASTGGVSAVNLDYETSTSHSLVITARDAGTPQMSSTATLQVSVTVSIGNSVTLRSLQITQVLHNTTLLPILNLMGNHPVACSGKPNHLQKAEPLRCLAMRTRGVRLNPA